MAAAAAAAAHARHKQWLDSEQHQGCLLGYWSLKPMWSAGLQASNCTNSLYPALCKRCVSGAPEARSGMVSYSARPPKITTGDHRQPSKGNCHSHSHYGRLPGGGGGIQSCVWCPFSIDHTLWDSFALRTRVNSLCTPVESHQSIPCGEVPLG